MKKILILFAHPALQKSRINTYLVKDLDRIEGVTFRDLYQIYPEFELNVTVEQKLLEQHDIIIFHHPFFWYSTPAILKEYQDLVLQHGWAYGKSGVALQGKILFNVITSGGRREAYSKKGHNNFTVRQLLAPIEQTANLCKMIFLPPFVLHGTHSIRLHEVELYKKDYIDLLERLRDDKIDIEQARSLDYLNNYEH